MKKFTIILSVVLLVIAGCIGLYFSLTTPKFTGDFTLETYQQQIDNPEFKSDNNYGEIKNYKDAVKAAQIAISDRFETTKGYIFQVNGCTVQYDKENEAYCVSQHIVFPPVFGGGYKVIIKTDGAIIAIWGEK